MRRSILIPGSLILTMAFVVNAEDNNGKHSNKHMHGHGHGHHGSDGSGHDEVNMPGLRGKNATAEESEEIRVLFRNFDTITREVDNLDNGIKTITKSSDPAVMSALVSHVVGMINRVDQKNDPEIIIQSPTLDLFFLKGDQINSAVEVTDEGIVVVQTSEDPEIAIALQKHAAEVSAMAESGMEAVHKMMMQRGGNH